MDCRVIRATGDDNENGQKARGLDKKNKYSARASRFMYLSLPSLHDNEVKLPNFTLFTFGQDVNTIQRPYFSFSELWYSPLEFNSRNIPQHLMNWTRWNTRNKVWTFWSCANTRFNSRFRSQAPHFYVTALIHEASFYLRSLTLSKTSLWTRLNWYVYMMHFYCFLERPINSNTNPFHDLASRNLF